MVDKLLQTNIKHETGYLYFIKKETDGCLGIYRAVMQHGRNKKE